VEALNASLTIALRALVNRTLFFSQFVCDQCSMTFTIITINITFIIYRSQGKLFSSPSLTWIAGLTMNLINETYHLCERWTTYLFVVLDYWIITLDPKLLPLRQLWKYLWNLLCHYKLQNYVKLIYVIKFVYSISSITFIFFFFFHFPTCIMLGSIVLLEVSGYIQQIQRWILKVALDFWKIQQI
jgi:hypothetical protein